MSAETATRTYWWDQYKVDLPAGVSGSVEIRPIVVTEEDATLGSLRAMFQGGRGRIQAGTVTGIYRNGSLWMSDTPDEIRDQMDAVRAARRIGGRVLVNGLGLGMFVKAVLAMDNVEHVDVVEIDPDVVALVGPTYAGPRCTIHTADALTIKWPVGAQWSVAWHDIWATLCEDNLEEVARLKRRYGRRVQWQEAWGEHLLRAERVRERRAGYGW